MPNRIVKESIWTSPNLNQVSDLAERHFYRLLPLPDDHGCCEVTPLVVKGRCYPLKNKVTPEIIQKWNHELEAADIIRTWEVSGRIYGWFPKWDEHQRIRSLHQRKTPEPPSNIVNGRRLSANDGNGCHSHLNPNPVLKPDLNPIPPIPPKGARKGELWERFSKFWETYPKKLNRGQAERAWQSLNPDESLFAEILQGVEKAKTSDKWRKDGGQYIPYPATWLRAKGWGDEYPEPSGNGDDTLELARAKFEKLKQERESHGHV